MGESIGVIKFLKELDNNIRNKQIFENKIVRLFESDDVKNIVDKIYIQPDIGLKQLISESQLTDEEIKRYLEILIADGLVRKFHSKEGENYELTPRMAEYYKKYINSQRDIIKKQIHGVSLRYKKRQMYYMLVGTAIHIMVWIE